MNLDYPNPKEPITIDWSHPLLRGCTSYWLPRGAHLVEMKSRRRATKTGVFRNAVVEGDVGIGPLAQGNNFTTHVTPGDDVTVVADIQWVSNGADTHNALFGTVPGAATGFEVLINASGGGTLWWAHTNNFAVNNTSKAMITGERGIVTFAYDSGTGLEMYFDATNIDSDAATGGLSTQNPLQAFARGDSWSGGDGLGTIYSLLVYDRQLTATEVRRIVRAPYQWVHRDILPVMVPPVAAAGLNIPIAAYHYNHHLGSMSN